MEGVRGANMPSSASKVNQIYRVRVFQLLASKHCSQLVLLSQELWYLIILIAALWLLRPIWLAWDSLPWVDSSAFQNGGNVVFFLLTAFGWPNLYSSFFSVQRLWIGFIFSIFFTQTWTPSYSHIPSALVSPMCGQTVPSDYPNLFTLDYYTAREQKRTRPSRPIGVFSPERTPGANLCCDSCTTFPMVWRLIRI